MAASAQTSDLCAAIRRDTNQRDIVHACFQSDAHMWSEAFHVRLIVDTSNARVVRYLIKIGLI